MKNIKMRMIENLADKMKRIINRSFEGESHGIKNEWREPRNHNSIFLMNGARKRVASVFSDIPENDIRSERRVLRKNGSNVVIEKSMIRDM